MVGRCLSPGSLLDSFQPIATIATTAIGAQQLQPLLQSYPVELWVPDSVQTVAGAKVYSGSLKNHVATLWQTQRSLVFCLAIGAVTRLIAPLLNSKATDPAVLVIDESGQFVIPLCGGHQAGADQLARIIAAQLGATPVLTGASHRAQLPGVDVMGLPFGWVKGAGDWTAVSAAIAREESVQVIQTAGSTLWQTALPANHPLQFEAQAESAPAQLLITSALPSASSTPTVYWHPRVLWVGLGCERGTPQAVMEYALRQVFAEHQLSESAIAGIATIDLKADEAGMLELCQERDLPLRCFSTADLQTVPVPNPSPIVNAEVGTPSVAEAAALLAASNPLLSLHPPSPLAKRGAARPHPPSPSLLIPKHIFRLDNHPGAVTIAVAQAAQEHTGRSGHLWLIGTGPGCLDQITPAAKAAIVTADVVIGYSLYVDLIASLLRPGQIIETLPITQERQRAERAIDLANWGLSVAVVSSGDCGIYGMAGLVMEQLQVAGWDGKTPSVQVLPGITALQAAASRVGTPLMHDFCAISLSDLLTPWEVIEKRLTAVAQADFVVALYNPKSQTRTEQITIAQNIFLQHRDPHTPVAIVRAAYRADEQITVTTLAEFLTHPIDMLTTVLIGNQSTRTHADWMITPRGYLGFE
ncbi:MAG: precorrin-3B C(17)-methyltransferase [Leptolyngbyaceae cyanobacterium bins.302]|nr:precorrin-3B C(17)-methyltransferase [Leptolyngbyaceae cyanobacterium bins.302]